MKQKYAGARVDNLLSAEYEKVKEQNRRLKAALQRVRKCEQWIAIPPAGITVEREGPWMDAADVMKASRPRK